MSENGPLEPACTSSLELLLQVLACYSFKQPRQRTIKNIQHTGEDPQHRFVVTGRAMSPGSCTARHARSCCMVTQHLLHIFDASSGVHEILQ